MYTHSSNVLVDGHCNRKTRTLNNVERELLLYACMAPETLTWQRWSDLYMNLDEDDSGELRRVEVEKKEKNFQQTLLSAIFFPFFHSIDLS